MKYFDKDDLTKKMNKWLNILNDNELSKNTLKRYRINITSFITFVSGKPINKDTIKQYKTKLEEKDCYLANTSNNYLVTVNKFLKYLNREKLCVKLFKIQRKDSIEEYISYTDYHRLLRCSLSKNDTKTYMLIRILAETGIRVEEMKFFTVEDLSETIIVKNKGKIRSIIVTKSLLAAIRKYIKNNYIHKGFIFPGRNNKPLSDSAIRKRLKKAAGYAKIKLSKVHPHSFRHYFAISYLEAHPDDIMTLCDLLGHSSLETTRIYTRLSNKQKERRLRNVKF